MELQVGVKVLLKNKEGKYLLLKRNPAKYPDMKAHWWDIPGGRIDPGSPLFDNLKREVKEETKLDLTLEPKLVAAQDILLPGRHVVRLTFTGELDGEPVIDEEHIEAGWFSSQEIYDLGDKLDRILCEFLEKKVIKL